MSKHSIGAYRELYREVDVSFEAVLMPEPSNDAERKQLMKSSRARVYTLVTANKMNRIHLVLKSVLPR